MKFPVPQKNPKKGKERHRIGHSHKTGAAQSVKPGLRICKLGLAVAF